MIAIIAAFFPTKDAGTICILGVTQSDFMGMASGVSGPGLLDFNELTERGIGLPSYLQLVYVQDQSDFDKRINDWLVSNGQEPSQFVELNKLPNVFETDK